MPGTPRKRPGGRTARTGQAVHDAVRALMAERGPDGFTGRDVAERAGVHEATIYRRWGTLDNLMLDVAAAVTRLNEKSPIPDTGSLRGDLRQWGLTMTAGLTPPGDLSLLRTVLAARSAEPPGQQPSPWIADFLAARTAVIQQTLDRATARGENPPGVTAVLDRFVAPLYLRAMFGYGNLDSDLDTLIDNTLAGPRGLLTRNAPRRAAPLLGEGLPQPGAIDGFLPKPPQMLNHVAWVTHDAQATAKFYTEIMGMALASAVYDDRVPSTGDAFLYFHIFFRMGDGPTIAFFEAPGLPVRRPVMRHMRSSITWLCKPPTSMRSTSGLSGSGTAAWTSSGR